MNRRILGMATAAALLPAVLPAQQLVPDSLPLAYTSGPTSYTARATVSLTTAVLPVALPDVRLALPDSALTLDLLPTVPLPRRWVRTGKWSLLAAAAGFSAYAMLHSRGDGPDTRAQIGIAGAHLTLLGSAGLFIYDLRHSRRDRENIPFEMASASSRTRGPAADAGVRGER